MLYATFNDTHVQEQHFAWYGTAGPSGGPAAAAAGGGGGAGGGAGSGAAGASSSGSNPHANLYPDPILFTSRGVVRELFQIV